MVWIDLDDTLWNMTGNARITLAELYHCQNLSNYFKSENDWIELYEVINKRLWNLYSKGTITESFLRNERFAAPLRLAGVISSEAKKKAEIFDPLYLDMLGRYDTLIDGAKELLETLKKDGYKLGILSNGFLEVQQRKMESSKITGYFDTVVLSAEIGINKPNEKLYRYAETKAGVKKEKCLMIGDSYATDISGAINAGWPAIWFTPPGATTQGKEIAGTDCSGFKIMRTENLDKIPGILKEHFPQIDE